MTKEELIFYMNQGREIECYVNRVHYFIQPDYEWNKNNTGYKVNMYLCNEDDEFVKKVFCGSPEDLLTVKLDGDKMLKEHWGLFTVELIF